MFVIRLFILVRTSASFFNNLNSLLLPFKMFFQLQTPWSLNAFQSDPVYSFLNDMRITCKVSCQLNDSVADLLYALEHFILTQLDVLHFSVHVFVDECIYFECKYTHTYVTKCCISFWLRGKLFILFLDS